MKNRKGFSLIELIAMIVVLGILMVITVPNIAGILKNNRENIVKEDISKAVASAKNKFTTKQAKYPPYEDSCTVMTLSYIDSNNDLKSGLNGGKYNTTESFVVIKKERESGSSFSYRYYIRLVEEIDRSGTIQKYEIPLTEQKELLENSKDYLTNMAPKVAANMSTMNTTDAITVLANMGLSCNSINQIYIS